MTDPHTTLLIPYNGCLNLSKAYEWQREQVPSFPSQEFNLYKTVTKNQGQIFGFLQDVISYPRAYGVVCKDTAVILGKIKDDLLKLR